MPNFIDTKNLFQQKIAWNKPPDGQAVAIKVTIDFSVQTQWTLDLGGSITTAQAENIQCCYVDNHLNSNAFTMIVNSTGQNCSVAGAAQNWVQLLMASPNTFTFFSAGTTSLPVVVYFCNFPQPSETNQLLNSTITNGHIQISGSGGGAVTVSDTILDSTVSGGAVNTRDVGLDPIISGGKLQVADSILDGIVSGGSASVSDATLNTLLHGWILGGIGDPAVQATSIYSGGASFYTLIANYLKSVKLTASGASAAVITGSVGYYITSITLQLAPQSTQATPGVFEVLITDSSAGTILTAEFYVGSTGLTADAVGPIWEWRGFWNSKISSSTLNVTLPADLSTGSLVVNVNYGLSTFLG